ncbi:MAG: hypothetical protein HYZ16_03850 [Bacteroidetes bacterium]|jgi:hypothetical protein|nr:hypothetical protein [Bacteroidota bacterium]
MNKARTQDPGANAKKNPFVRALEIDFISKSDIQKWFPFALYCAAWAFVYIANRIYAEKNERLLNQLHVEVRDARADYYTIVSRIENLRKPSEIERRVRHLGLRQDLKPAETIKKSD